MSKRFEGQVALVTGASRGIGYAIAERLVAEGAKVCVTARKQEALDEAIDGLGGSEHAMAVAGKGDDPEHHADTVGRVLRQWGRVDMLVNNTGINPVYGDLMELDLGAARKIFDVNVLGALSWAQQVHRLWMADNGGTVLNVSSVAGERPAPGIGFYGTTKAALTHLTQELAVELAPSVRVNAVAPAVVKTQFATALFEGNESEAAEQYPMKRLGFPSDIGSAAAYLLSADAAWVTGQVLVLDGGGTLTGGV